MTEILFTLSLGISITLSALTWKHWRVLKANKLAAALSSPWPWQVLYTIVIVIFGGSGWLVIPTFALSFTCGMLVDTIVCRKDIQRVGACLPPNYQREFEAFVIPNVDLKYKILDLPELHDGYTQQLRTDLALIFLSFGESAVEAKKIPLALQSLRWSNRFQNDNPLVWVRFAEIYAHLNDRCAARWAKKVLTWVPSRNTPPFVVESLQHSSFSGVQLEMESIVDLCNKNSDWHDSGNWMEPEGL